MPRRSPEVRRPPLLGYISTAAKLLPVGRKDLDISSMSGTRVGIGSHRRSPLARAAHAAIQLSPL
jgi:hypothetical protein